MVEKRILIVHHDTIGLAHDARVLTAALNNRFSDLVIRYVVIPGRLDGNYSLPIDLPQEVETLTPFHYMFLLEHVYSNPPLCNEDFAHRIIFVPNIEWLLDIDEATIASRNIHMVWLKNHFSFKLFSALPIARAVNRVELTGWTSEDIALEASDIEAKEFNQFLHVRGISAQKQTEMVMETWARHPEFPQLTIVLHFRGGFELLKPLRYASNVAVHLGVKPSLEVRRLQNAIGLHLCPSKREGFGHTLNEARAASSVLITTDGPPMNEFVAHGDNGLLIPVKPNRISPVRRSFEFEITSESLSEQIESLLSMPVSRRKDMGERSRDKFVSDRDRFYRNLQNCLEL